MSWANLPRDLIERPQWCLAAPAGLYSQKGKEPLTVDHTGTIHFAKSNQPSTWLDWENASYWAGQYGYHLGYMLHEDDPFSCIDLDVKDASNEPDPNKWTTRERYNVYTNAIQAFDSYTEYSASGKGFHIWVRGKIGRGFRHNGIEVYSRERFMICTGNLVVARPVENREAMLASFAEHYRPKHSGDGRDLEELPEEADDFYILKKAFGASNGQKFSDLWNGRWESMVIETPRYEYVEGAGRVQVGVDVKRAYESQSEADLSLMSMLTFYSPSNAQCKRLFRDSQLGKRDKAQKDDRYLNLTLKGIRAREYNEQKADVSKVVKALETKALIEQEIARLQQSSYNESEVVVPLHLPNAQVTVAQLPNTPAALALAAPVNGAIAAAAEEGMQWPPGVLGKVAHFVYNSSFLRVKEVSIVTAIGFLAGIAGKAWHVNNSGLNQYVTLIGRSGIGKEAMHSGMSLLVRAVAERNPSTPQFVSFDDFASGPALTKYCAATPSFVNVCGEWGHKLKRMARSEDGRDQAITTLRQVMTNLYQKSGPQSIVGGIKYSDKDNNAQSVSGVAYSMIGETTPGTYFESLTEPMMEDGFLSRFLTIEYKGNRPEANSEMILKPEDSLVDALAAIVDLSVKTLGYVRPAQAVGRSQEAASIFFAFENECRDKINGSENEAFRQMWNRAALKALRLAGLCAVADAPHYANIEVQHAVWAIDIVRRDIAIMESRISSGDVGSTDLSRHRKLAAVIRHYMQKPLPPSRLSEQKFKDNGVVTRKYLQVYCAQSSAFAKYKGGTTLALGLTLQSFIDQGYIAEVEKSKAVKDFSFNGRCYRILDIPSEHFGEN